VRPKDGWLCPALIKYFNAASKEDLCQNKDAVSCEATRTARIRGERAMTMHVGDSQENQLRQDIERLAGEIGEIFLAGLG
jgi:hypothetical protein